MAYRSLRREEIPSSTVEEVLQRCRIPVCDSDEPLRESVRKPRCFVRSIHPYTGQIRGTLAAFSDQRPSPHHSRLTIGVEGIVRIVPVPGESVIAVQCRANNGTEQLGCKFAGSDPVAACDLLLSFVEYAGLWIDAEWFAGYPYPVAVEAKPASRPAELPSPRPLVLPDGVSTDEAVEYMLQYLREPLIGDVL
jgi:hypothetical protein